MIGQTVTFREGKKVSTFNIDEMMGVQFSQAKLQEALTKHAALATHYFTLHGAAVVLRERAKARLDGVVVELDARVRAEIATGSGHKVTETAIRNIVEGTKEYKRAIEDFLDAREQEETLQAIREGFRHKKDVLIVLANNFRLERDTDPGGKIDRNRS
jgi:hypothetical protein